jgi:cell division protein FtsB
MIRIFIFNFFIFLCCLYFGFHLIWGQKGYVKYKQVYSAFEGKIEQVSKLESRRVVLEQKNSLFGRSALDLDALDEFSKRALGIAGKGDYVVPVKNADQKK